MVSTELIDGRYAVLDAIASGGMATVHLGKLVGPAGFTRIVAIKKLLPELARDPEFAVMFLDEARMACRVQHPNVVSTLDAVQTGADLLLVMEYIHGVSLNQLLRLAQERGLRPPLAVAIAIAVGVLQGLHAAHEATGDNGLPLDLVHRDVSPHNVIIGADGVARIVDFGIAKAIGRAHVTRQGQVKGKLPYLSPEQLRGADADRQSDVWGASVVLWETLTCTRLFKAASEAAVYGKVLHERIRAPSDAEPSVPQAVDAVVLRGLSRDRAGRFETARAMARALEAAARPGTPTEVAEWIEAVASEELQRRSQHLARAQALPVSPREESSPDSEPAATEVMGTRTLAAIGLAEPQRRRRAGLAIALLAGVLVFLLAWSSNRPSVASSPAPPASGASVSPDTTGASATPLEPVSVPAERAAERPLPPRPASRSPAPARTPTRPRPATSTEPRADACRWIDAAGIWHLRPECLQ